MVEREVLGIRRVVRVLSCGGAEIFRDYWRTYFGEVDNLRIHTPPIRRDLFRSLLPSMQSEVELVRCTERCSSWMLPT